MEINLLNKKLLETTKNKEFFERCKTLVSNIHSVREVIKIQETEYNKFVKPVKATRKKLEDSAKFKNFKATVNYEVEYSALSVLYQDLCDEQGNNNQLILLNTSDGGLID